MQIQKLSYQKESGQDLTSIIVWKMKTVEKVIVGMKGVEDKR